MSRILQRRRQQPAQANRPTMTAKMFIENKYIEVKDLLTFVDSGRADDVEDFETFFDFVKDKGKFINTRRVREDKGGIPYQFVNFLNSQGSSGAKVVLIGKMKQFIDEFHGGTFYTDFSLEDLVTEAESQL
jgi:hypothetical protein